MPTSMHHGKENPRCFLQLKRPFIVCLQQLERLAVVELKAPPDHFLQVYRVPLPS